MDNSVSSLQEISKAAKVKSKKRKKSNDNNKKKPIKVVYIPNPMKVKASASEFRALVQELTGQDADLPDPTKFTNNADDVHGANQTVPDAAVENGVHDQVQQVSRLKENNQTVPDAAQSNTDDHAQEVSSVEENNQTVPDAARSSTDDRAQEVSGVGEQAAGHHHQEQQCSTRGHFHDVPFETLDEVFATQMLENLTEFLPPGLLL